MPYYPPRQEESQRSDPPRKHSAARWILLCVSTLLLLYGGFRLITYLSDLSASRQTTKELREIADQADARQEAKNVAVEMSIPEDETVLPESTAAPAEKEEETENKAVSVVLPEVPYPSGYEVVPRIRELRKKSKYIIGWLTMDDLDEPVAHKDNSYFLNHDATGKRNINGSIFMDEHTSLLTRPYTILLYGHNMKTGAMFGNLRKYETFSYCYRHRMIQFDTLYEEGQYVIFAVETISITPGKSKYLNLAALQSSDRAIRSDALKVLVERSPHKMMLDVNENDQLLLLITCVGDDDERLIVAARRLRDEEMEKDKLEEKYR